jgi:hypothetical protein
MCFEDLPYPADYACAAGCLIIATARGAEEDASSVAFARPDGLAMSSTSLVAEPGSGHQVNLEAGVYFLDTSRFEIEPDVSSVRFEYIDMETYYAAFDRQDEIVWQGAGVGKPTARATFAAPFRATGLAAGPYFIRGVFTYADGSSRIALTSLEVR